MADEVELSTKIHAPPEKVWKALTDPGLIKSYMMGSTVKTDWQVGHPISWSGNYQGNAYEDKGEITAFEPNRRLGMTHWSPLSKLVDAPENYHRLSYVLAPADKGTKVTFTQENLTGVSEEQSRKNWQPVLDGLKMTAEQ